MGEYMDGFRVHDKKRGERPDVLPHDTIADDLIDKIISGEMEDEDDVGDDPAAPIPF